MDDEDCEPRPGHIRQQRARGRKTFVGEVVKHAKRAAKHRAGAQRFDGSQSARGTATGRLLASRGPRLGSGARRIIIKTRLIRLGPKALTAAATHIRYLQRDGITRDGERGHFYGADADTLDAKAFLERGADDRHQFRFIIAPEDGDRLDDLKPFIRRLMARMEQDLDRRLDWIAIDHFDTGHPHTHVLLRGRDDHDRDLVIAPDYIRAGMRERASDLLTAEFGPRTALEIADRLHRDVDAERLTDIDRELIAGQDKARIVETRTPDPVEQALRIGRLRRLARMGLATRIGQDHWQLPADLEATLRRMGERGDIIRGMQRAMTARGIDRNGAAGQIHEALTAPVTGQVIARGLADEEKDRHYLLVDGIDGRLHHVAIGKADAVEQLPAHAIVRISARDAIIREVDRTIVAIAATQAGWYDEAVHRRFDPRASTAFIETHVRRLEALRRTAHLVERDPFGRWAVAGDHLAKIAAFEQRQLGDRPVHVEILSRLPLSALPRAHAATWLDHRLLTPGAEPLKATGFGRDVERAVAARQQWLVREGLAWADSDRTRYRPDLIAVLQRRELLRVAGQLSEELKLPFVEGRPGDRISGRLGRPVDLASSRFVTVERAHDFTLVPWRRIFERQLGKSGSGMMRDDGINWSIGRERGGPEIS